MSYSEEKIHPMGNKIKHVYFIFFLVTFLTILTFTADLSQNSGELCSKCHSMRPQYYTWQASSHSNMGCIDCHTYEGFQGAYSLAQDMVRWTYAEVTQSYILPIRLFRGVDDNVCFTCHSFNREATVPGNLIIPHDAHTDSRVRCVSCHSAVAHGDIAKRAITRKIDISQWDEDEGLQQMARSLVQTNKTECMSCHYRRKVTTSCEACHGELLLPEYHEVQGFEKNHGYEASVELQDCNFCHGWTGPKKMEVTERTKLIDYSRNNRFCLSCHRVRPESHGGDVFKSTHGNAINTGQRETDGCIICHDLNTTDLPVVTQVSCSSCHPAKHSKNWRQGHMPMVPPGQGIQQSCFMCHSANTCLNCHYFPGYASRRSNVPVLDDFDDFGGLPAGPDGLFGN
jgi:hypothetical protein